MGRQCGTQFFDLSEADRVLHAFEGQSAAPGAELLTVTLNTDALPQHLTSYGQLMVVVLTRKLRGYFPVPGDYSRLNVGQWLNDRLTEECSGPIRKVVAADLLDCANAQVMQFLHLGVIQWVYLDNRNFVDGRSLLDYKAELSQCTCRTEGGLLS